MDKGWRSTFLAVFALLAAQAIAAELGVPHDWIRAFVFGGVAGAASIAIPEWWQRRRAQNTTDRKEP